MKMTKHLTLMIGAVAMATTAFAASGQKEPIAEGYMDWEGLASRNFLTGHLISPSDLRHRAVVYVAVDANAFTGEKVADFSDLATLAPLPQSHATTWETYEMRLKRVVVVSVRNLGKTEPKEFLVRFRPPKNSDANAARKYQNWYLNSVPFYKDMKPVGEQELPAEKLPYVAVYGGSGTKPLYEKEKWTPADIKNVRAALTKAVNALEDLKPPLGVEEPQFFKKVATELAKGKPAQNLLNQLKSGIKSKNPEQSKEAQIMFDSLNQYKSDLMLRIQLEFSSAPARAYYDYQTLVKLFPSEKKNLQEIDAKLKANKEIGALGKIFEKVMLWSREDYVCKNAGEVKKNVMELQKIKKTLESLANSDNAKIQGEAMLFQSQIDALIEIMPAKVQLK